MQRSSSNGEGARAHGGGWNGYELRGGPAVSPKARIYLEASATKPKQLDQDEGLADMSVNRSHRSGVDESGTGSPAHESGNHDSSESTKVPAQQIPLERSPEINDTEGHPT